MKTTTTLATSLIAALAAACGRPAEPTQAQRIEDSPGRVTAGVAPGEGADTRVQAGQADKSGPGAAAQDTAPGAAKDPAGAPAMMLIGVHVESPLAAACGITLPPAAFFEFDSADLDLPPDHNLHAVARCLTTGPLAGRKIELIGHTDPRGDDEYNRQLGRSRAQAVQDFLQKRGVAEGNIVTRSLGEQRAEEEAPKGWPADRRVDIRLLPQQ